MNLILTVDLILYPVSRYLEIRKDGNEASGDSRKDGNEATSIQLDLYLYICVYSCDVNMSLFILKGAANLCHLGLNLNNRTEDSHSGTRT